MRTDVRDWLATCTRPILLDGATGTELERRGIPCPAPLWSAAALRDAPQAVAAIHREYVAAGADILVANTFRTNPRTLARAGLRAAGPLLVRRAVQLAREAAATGGRTVLVAASVGPAEDCYRPDLVPAERELAAEHDELMDWLAAAGPDFVWIETMNTVREAAAAARAAAARGLPSAVSWVLREDGALLGGERLVDAVAAVVPSGPVVLGLNCIPPRGLAALLPGLRALAHVPLAAYGHIHNARPLPGWSYAEAAAASDYARSARAWRAAGATIVGGCCGTTPAHIAALRATVLPGGEA